MLKLSRQLNRELNIVHVKILLETSPFICKMSNIVLLKLLYRNCFMLNVDHRKRVLVFLSLSILGRPEENTNVWRVTVTVLC